MSTTSQVKSFFMFVQLLSQALLAAIKHHARPVFTLSHNLSDFPEREISKYPQIDHFPVRFLELVQALQQFHFYGGGKRLLLCRRCVRKFRFGVCQILVQWYFRMVFSTGRSGIGQTIRHGRFRTRWKSVPFNTISYAFAQDSTRIAVDLIPVLFHRHGKWMMHCHKTVSLIRRLPEMGIQLPSTKIVLVLIDQSKFFSKKL